MLKYIINRFYLFMMSLFLLLYINIHVICAAENINNGFGFTNAEKNVAIQEFLRKGYTVQSGVNILPDEMLLLEVLDYSGITISQYGHYDGLMTALNLREIIFSNCGLTSNMLVNVLRGITYESNITRIINLNNNNISEIPNADLLNRLFGDEIISPFRIELILDNNPFTALNKVYTNANVKIYKLSLNNTQLSSTELNKFLAFPILETLSINNNNYSQTYFDAFFNMASLKVLSAKDNGFTSFALDKFPIIEEVNLDNNDIPYLSKATYNLIKERGINFSVNAQGHGIISYNIDNDLDINDVKFNDYLDLFNMYHHNNTFNFELLDDQEQLIDSGVLTRASSNYSIDSNGLLKINKNAFDKAGTYTLIATIISGAFKDTNYEFKFNVVGTMKLEDNKEEDKKDNDSSVIKSEGNKDMPISGNSNYLLITLSILTLSLGIKRIIRN